MTTDDTESGMVALDPFAEPTDFVGWLGEYAREIEEDCVPEGAVHPDAPGWHRGTKTAEAKARVVAAYEGAVRERDEMRDALRAVGIFRSDEAGDDGSEWCVTLHPRGEEPVGTLDEALRRTLDAESEALRAELCRAREDYWEVQAALSATKLLVPLDESTDGPKAGWAGVVERVRRLAQRAERLEADKARLDSGCIRMEINVADGRQSILYLDVDLRTCIDDARAAVAARKAGA